MNRQLEIEMAEHLDWEDVIDFLDAGFTYRKSHPEHDKVTFYDTFDWRFYKKNLTLSRAGQQFKLQELDSDKVSLRFNWLRKTPYRFATDHNDPVLAEAFAKIQDIRAVSPIAEVAIKSNCCEALNQDEKIVCRIKYEEISTNGEEVENVLKIIPVKGYDDEAEVICKSLAKAGLNTPSSTPALLPMVLEHLHIIPGTYSSKIKTVLTPDMTPRNTASLLISEMLTVIRANEGGIIENIDTEFLHDFRVSVRRIRALISQLKKIYPEDIAAAIKADFGELGKMTNRLRDCDVLLNARKEYEDMLPEVLREGLKLFFKGIVDTRRREMNRFTEYLQSEKYETKISHWIKFVEKDLHKDKIKSGDKTIIDISGKVIMKRFGKIITIIDSIEHDTPDEFIHGLRIECKKLRYSLEFFSSLYPDNASEPVARLKVIQTLLGDFNDYSVQIAELTSKIDRLPAGKGTNQIAASLGGLIAILGKDKAQLRESCLKELGKFTDDANQLYFKNMFTPGKKPEEQ